MADKDPERGPVSQGSAQPAAPPPHQPRRTRLWLLLAALVLLAGGGILATQWPSSGKQPEPESKPLEGKLLVIVRPPERAVEPLEIDKPGAVPVRADGIMSLEVELSQPGYTYLVWFDCEGRVLPLYPWNPETLEIQDINQPPPVRKATNVIFSPPIGGGWKFGKKGGLETVLLLARRTPLGEGTRLGPLLGTLPVPKVRHRGEVAVLGLDRGADAVSTQLALNRGTDDEARAVDEPLRALMLRLRDHFDVIRAVRFAHVEESEIDKK
jgi:hypothetical protein